MIRFRANIVAVLAIASILFSVAGCKSGSASAKKTPPKPTVAAPAPHKTAEDVTAKSGGCDERLQDLSGLLLLFGSKRFRLPESLDELRAFPGAQSLSYICPVSGKPYIYDAQGLPTPSGKGRVVLYDAVAAHSGMRLCISIEENPNSGAMVTKVIALPDAFFKPRAD